MRELTVTEIASLERQGCTADDWSGILVDENFTASAVTNVNFYGHIEIGSLNGTIEVEEGFRRNCTLRSVTLHNVRIGDGCLIENIRGHISGYVIGDGCYIADCGILSIREGATFGQGHTIAVLNEGGDGNVTLHPGLTAQTAWLMVHGYLPTDCHLFQPDGKGTIGNNVRIIGTRELTDTQIGDGAEIRCASRICNCTIQSSDDAATFIGSDVLLDSSIVSSGASVMDGAKIAHCFVGESVHVGRGFSAECSLFFANSYMDNGEACAAFCGPYSTSHHKSTLLIGGEFSFYNAGSATNQSNHAYKMGPIHWGTLGRGSKTASGSHILWPASFAPFTMVMGKVTSHPNLSQFPFSYVIASGDQTYLVPGINIRTIGTWRDVNKWPKRDLRPLSERHDIVRYDFPDAYTIQQVLKAKTLLHMIETEQGTDTEEYTYQGCTIRRTALLRAYKYYDMAIGLFLLTVGNIPAKGRSDEWIDLCGMPVTLPVIEQTTEAIANGYIDSIADLNAYLKSIADNYQYHASLFARYVLEHESNDDYIDEDIVMQRARDTHTSWLRMVRNDAEKEYQMGDVDETFLRKIIDQIR